MVITRESVEGRMRSHCLMSMEFQFGKMKIF